LLLLLLCCCVVVVVVVVVVVDVYECSMYVRVVRTIIETCKSP